MVLGFFSKTIGKIIGDLGLGRYNPGHSYVLSPVEFMGCFSEATIKYYRLGNL